MATDARFFQVSSKVLRTGFKETPIHLIIMTRIHTLYNHYYIIITTCSFSWIPVNYHQQSVKSLKGGLLIELTNANRFSAAQIWPPPEHNLWICVAMFSNQPRVCIAGAGGDHDFWGVEGAWVSYQLTSSDQSNRVIETGRRDLIKLLSNSNQVWGTVSYLHTHLN